LLFLVSQWIPIYIERALLPSGVIFCVWLAWTLFKTRLPILIRNTLLVMLAVGAAFGLHQHLAYRGFPYAPYRELVSYLRPQLAPGDVILHSSKLTMFPAVYFDPSLPQTYLADPPGSSVDTLAPATQDVLMRMAESNLESATAQAEHTWFIIFKQSNLEYIERGEPMHPHLLWLTDHYALIETQSWGDVRLYLFAQKP
jgi:hypothetical protein